ncbi:hypothetical protein BJ912DRAFT_230 [Pholiota molesta]|nr:hypothetical protein BJ912DRAFT_230 [Pholiota molesta]
MHRRGWRRRMKSRLRLRWTMGAPLYIAPLHIKLWCCGRSRNQTLRELSMTTRSPSWMRHAASLVAFTCPLVDVPPSGRLACRPDALAPASSHDVATLCTLINALPGGRLACRPDALVPAWASSLTRQWRAEDPAPRRLEWRKIEIKPKSKPKTRHAPSRMAKAHEKPTSTSVDDGSPPIHRAPPH